MLSKLRGYLRKYHKLQFALVALLVGIVFIVVSIISFGNLNKKKVEVTATITSIDVITIEEADTTYNVYVTYKDAQGKTYNDVLYPTHQPNMKVGDTVTAYYDAEKPDTLLSNNKFLPYIFLILGIVSVALAIFLTITTFKVSVKDANELDQVKDEQLTEENKQKVLDSANEPENVYYFHFTGKLNQSYVMETNDKKPVMEANCDKIGIVTKFKFTFVNHLTGKETPHEVSHTTTTSYDNFTDKSYFKIDGVNCWQYIAKEGYSLDADFKDLTHFTYTVKRYGIKVGKISTAGSNVLKEGNKDDYNLMSVQGCYVVNCKQSDLEGFFAACFILARVNIAF